MRKLVSWIVLFAIYIGLVAPFAATGQITAKAMEDKLKDVPPGLAFSLSEGQESAETRVKETLPSTDPLTQAQAADLLKRLPAIKSDASDQTDFAKRVGTLPPPKTGNKIPVKFPSDQDAAPFPDACLLAGAIRPWPARQYR